jgi:hypothetical protein
MVNSANKGEFFLWMMSFCTPYARLPKNHRICGIRGSAFLEIVPQNDLEAGLAWHVVINSEAFLNREKETKPIHRFSERPESFQPQTEYSLVGRISVQRANVLKAPNLVAPATVTSTYHRLAIATSSR